MWTANGDLSLPSSPDDFEEDSILLGCRVGGHTLGRLIGSGAAGAVFESEHASFGRTAVKVLPKPEDDDQISWGLFEREVMIGQVLDHPAIIKTLEFCKSELALFVFMEFFQGTALDETLEGGPMSGDDFINIFEPLSAGLQAAHDQGVIHRDLKPENILTDGKNVKILDFGLARWNREEGLTQTNQFKGTINYCSPEQITESRSVGPASDQFAFGLICFLALTGKLPYPMASKNPFVNLMERLNQDAFKLRRMDPSLPEGAEVAVAKMLERDPGDRFDTVVSAFQSLRSALQASH